MASALRDAAENSESSWLRAEAGLDRRLFSFMLDAPMREPPRTEPTPFWWQGLRLGIALPALAPVCLVLLGAYSLLALGGVFLCSALVRLTRTSLAAIRAAMKLRNSGACQDNGCSSDHFGSDHGVSALKFGEELEPMDVRREGADESSLAEESCAEESCAEESGAESPRPTERAGDGDERQKAALLKISNKGDKSPTNQGASKGDDCGGRARLIPPPLLSFLHNLCVSRVPGDNWRLVGSALGLVVTILTLISLNGALNLGDASMPRMYAAMQMVCEAAMLLSYARAVSAPAAMIPGGLSEHHAAYYAAIERVPAGEGLPSEFDERSETKKPPRAKFSPICGGLVRVMDHDCIWLGVCICESNHVAFVSFLIFANASLLLLISSYVAYLPSFWTMCAYAAHADPKRIVARLRLLVLAVGIILEFSIFFLLGFQLWGVLFNVTTVEASKSRPICPICPICHTSFHTVVTPHSFSN